MIEMTPTGLDGIAVSHCSCGGWRASTGEGGTKSGTVAAEMLPDDLRELLAAWPELSPETRFAVLCIVRQGRL